jgi:hypothetical protein
MRIISDGNPEGKLNIWRPMRIWDHDIKTNVKEIWWDCVVWINLAQDINQWEFHKR